LVYNQYILAFVFQYTTVRLINPATKCSTTAGDSLKCSSVKLFAKEQGINHETGRLRQRAGWGSSHTHKCLSWYSGTGRGEAEDIAELGGQSARRKYWGGRKVMDRRMIRKPGSNIVVGKRQPATGTGRWEPGSAAAELVVGDRRWTRSPGS